MRWMPLRRGSIALLLGLGLCSWSASAAPPGGYPTSAGGWIDRSGFGELLARSIIVGGYAGGMVGLALSDLQLDAAGSSRRIGLGTVIGSAAGLAVPLLLAQGEVRTGDVVFMGSAQALGAANGFFLPLTIQVAGCSTVAGCPTFDTLTTLRIDSALSAVLAVGGGAATLLAARKMSFTPGQADALGSAAIWGALVGFTISIAVAPNFDPPALVLGTTLGLADVGFAAAWFFRDFFDMDRSRVGFLNLGVLLGGGAGAAMAYFISPSRASATAISLAVLAGAGVGWGVAYYASSGLDGYKVSAPPDRPAAAGLGAPGIRPLASLARGDPAVGLQFDLLQGRF